MQVFAAQAYGAGRYRRAGAAAWSGIWASLLVFPAFLLLAWAGPLVLFRLGLDREVMALAVEYWQPRMAGGLLALLLWAPMSYFYGTGQVRTAVLVNLVVAVSNALLNELLMFRLGLGIAGAAWATNLALAIGFADLDVHLHPDCPAAGASTRGTACGVPGARRSWRCSPSACRIGAMIAFDLLGLAVFQLMMTRLGVVEAAATQIVMMLTSLAYHAGSRARHGRDHAGGAIDRRRQPCLGAPPRQSGDPDGGRSYGRRRPAAGGCRPMARARFSCRRPIPMPRRWCR